MKRNNKYFNVKDGQTIGISANGNLSFNVGGGIVPGTIPFIMKVNSGTNSQFMVPAQGIGYDYTIVTSDGQTFTGETGNKTITFPAADTDYDVFITGAFPRIYFNNSTHNSVRLKEIKQWGNQKWKSMQGAFTYCQNMIGTYIDMPDLSNVTNMSRMFEDAITFNQDISSWDVSNVTNMNSMLQGTTAMTENLDWSDPITGSINVLDITNFALNSALTSIKLQAGAVTSTHYAFRSAFSLTELILIDMSVDFDISDTALTGAAIDALADSVLDMTGQTSPTITMTQAQLNSCDYSKWLDKNWATVPATQTIPVADFVVNNATPNRYQNIQFTDTSTGNPTTWLWDFGDGNTSTLQNPTHSYEYGDEDYTVTLTVTNSTGTSTETKTDYISLGEVPFRTLMRRDGDNMYIPANTPGYTFNYSVNGFGGLITGLTDNYIYLKNHASTNTFWAIDIGGKYPTFDSSNTFNWSNRTVGLYRWGTIKWESMENFFINRTGVTGNGYYTNEDVPDLRLVTSMENMFRNTNMRNIKNFSEWDVSTVTNMVRVFSRATTMAEEVDWSDPVRGSVSATNIQGFAFESALTSIKLQAGVVTNALNAFMNAASLTELILIDMSIGFDIATTGLTGAAIDALADSVADMTGKSKPTIAMTQAQLNSCDQSLWSNKNWTIQLYANIPFIFTANSSANKQLLVGSDAPGYNYNVKTSDGQTFTGLTGRQYITFPLANTNYDIEITGIYPSPTSYVHSRIVNVKQWGNQKWKSLAQAFDGSPFTDFIATDTPDLSQCTSMSFTFAYSNFNGNINHWDTSNIESFHRTFIDAKKFNKPLNNWNTSKVTTMQNMFHGADKFNQPLNNWDTSKVTNMNGLFYEAPVFNGNISNWDTSKVTDMSHMFNGATVFNGNISNWDTSKVTNMRSMFNFNRAFDLPLNNWDTSKVTNMNGMFRDSIYKQPLNLWDTSNVTDMGQMFRNSPFNQNISSWNVTKVTQWTNFRLGSLLSNWNTPPKFR